MDEYTEKCMNVRQEHLDYVADLFLAGRGIPGVEFNMKQWGPYSDCDTAACFWGHAYILANEEPTDTGPDTSWVIQSPFHRTVDDLFYATSLSAKHLAALYKGIMPNGLYVLDGVDLSGIAFDAFTFKHASLMGTNFSRSIMGAVRFVQCDMDGASFCESDIRNVWLDWSRGKVDFGGARLGFLDVLGPGGERYFGHSTRTLGVLEL